MPLDLCHSSVAHEHFWCDHDYLRWGGHNTSVRQLCSISHYVLGAPASIIGSELPRARLRPFALPCCALRGTSGGATMTIPGGTGTPQTTKLQLFHVLGAPASLIGSELPWLTSSGLYTVAGRALHREPLGARPLALPPSTLRGNSGGATMTYRSPGRLWFPPPPRPGFFLCTLGPRARQICT